MLRARPHHESGAGPHILVLVSFSPQPTQSSWSQAAAEPGPSSPTPFDRHKPRSIITCSAPGHPPAIGPCLCIRRRHRHSASPAFAGSGILEGTGGLAVVLVHRSAALSALTVKRLSNRNRCRGGGHRRARTAPDVEGSPRRASRSGEAVGIGLHTGPYQPRNSFCGRGFGRGLGRSRGVNSDLPRVRAGDLNRRCFAGQRPTPRPRPWPFALTPARSRLRRSVARRCGRCGRCGRQTWRRSWFGLLRSVHHGLGLRAVPCRSTDDNQRHRSGRHLAGTGHCRCGGVFPFQMNRCAPEAIGVSMA